MKNSRIVVFLLLLGNIAIFFTMQNDFDENGQWTLVGSALLLAMMWVYLGDTPKPKKSGPQVRRMATNPSQKTQQSVDIPEVVVKDELDGASLRERKMAKVAANKHVEDENMVTVDPDDDLEEIAVTIEEVHVADEFVVEVSPQSIEDANIAAHIKNKKEQHDKIRVRIEERRRGQMAEIRASTAKMWEDHSAGEDLVSLIQSDDHGQEILIEPATAEAGHVYGATLVRINESTILKLRVPLDSGYVKVEGSRNGPVTDLPEGVPTPEEMGLPLPPPPGASGALAALRDEMAED
ncbi:MAG: hypothetical protein DWC02_02000 [Candidatus Poseidoniales archaeon]|nr:MAG: hypothetical protein DWC02_02000 [Candidatus Poseidoniales archaeon]